MAGKVAKELVFTIKSILADWKTYEKTAGAICNQQKLDESTSAIYTFHKNIENYFIKTTIKI